MSNNQKSLDDFCKLFFGIDNGSFVTRTYTLDEVISTLNQVQPYDWAGFFRTRVYDVDPETPKGGITNGGYQLVYNDDMPEWQKHMDASQGVNFTRSLGFSLTPDGNLQSVIWNSRAFKAGITPDMQLQAINDQKFTVDTLREAIKSAEKSKEPIKLLLKRGDDFVTISLDYHDGLRYPHLERVDSVPDRLDAILAPAK
jgi:predicted metalloprotease with PDZ domain